MSSTHDDAFREIQLSGKQLVFLFMAVVVIAVVIFLTGVQVGRGVRAERGALPEGTEASASPGAAEAEPPAPPVSASSDRAAPPVTSGEVLSYAERLSGTEPPPEPRKGAGTPASAPPPEDTTPTPKPEAPVPADSPQPVPGVTTEPAGVGFAIQVAALREREEADSIVKRLAGKGYPAYVLAPAAGAPEVYRVRVGKFTERREADTVAARLQKEEQFKPWVVR